MEDRKGVYDRTVARFGWDKGLTRILNRLLVFFTLQLLGYLHHLLMIAKITLCPVPATNAIAIINGDSPLPIDVRVLRAYAQDIWVGKNNEHANTFKRKQGKYSGQVRQYQST